LRDREGAPLEDVTTGSHPKPVGTAA
jgi:hypothetical protein